MAELENPIKVIQEGLAKSCFAAGTKLWTPQGYRVIEEIAVGETVWSRDEWNPAAPVEAKVVEEVFQRFARVMDLRVAGRVIRTTGEHPLYAAVLGWTEASSMTTGMELLTDTADWEVVYNLRVADHHTYFVGDDDWRWAHNAYLGLSDSVVRQEGMGYAELARGWWDTLPGAESSEPSPAKGSTVAVTIVGTKKYVALYANLGSIAKQYTQDQIDAFIASAVHAGWTPIVTSGRIHAERALHEQVPNCSVIGISNSNGPCAEFCKDYIERVKFFNIVWPGSIPATWGKQ